MTTQQLTQRLDRFDNKFAKRKFRVLKTTVRRAAKARQRKARSLAIAWYRRQYFLSTAHRDLKLAVARNEDIFIGVLLVAAVLSYSYAVVAAQTMFTFFESTYAMAEVSGVNFLIMLAFTLTILGVVLFWVAALTFNALSTALMHGANRKLNRSIRQTLRHSLRYASRTTMVWIMLLVRVALPLALAAFIALIIVTLNTFALAQTRLILAVIVGLIGLFGSIGTLLRYSLTPQVALFEPQLGFQDSFRRSRQLTARAGRTFLLVGYLAMAALLTGAYGLSMLIDRWIHLGTLIPFTLALIAGLIYMSGISTMLYRKRRNARR